MSLNVAKHAEMVEFRGVFSEGLSSDVIPSNKYAAIKTKSWNPQNSTIRENTIKL